MKHYKYRAQVRLDPPASPAGQASQLGPGSRVTVRAGHRQTGNHKFFSALVSAFDGPASPQGAERVEMTLTVLGDDVPDYLEAGDEFSLWRGHDIGHGIITRRLSLWAESP